MGAVAFSLFDTSSLGLEGSAVKEEVLSCTVPTPPKTRTCPDLRFPDPEYCLIWTGHRYPSRIMSRSSVDPRSDIPLITRLIPLCNIPYFRLSP